MKWKKRYNKIQHRTYPVVRVCRSLYMNFTILIVSTYYILFISWIIKCLIIIDARCEHEDYVTFIQEIHPVSGKIERIV